MAPSHRRLNAPLLDKLLFGTVFTAEAAGPTGDEGIGRHGIAENPAVNPLSVGEYELQFTVQRELAWLLNSVQLEAGVDLSPYPEVKTSVLNYGVANLIGLSQSDHVLQERAAAIRQAVLAFEPRFDRRGLTVTAQAAGDRQNAVTFLINGQIRTDDHEVRTSFYTDLMMDTGAATVRD